MSVQINIMSLGDLDLSWSADYLTFSIVDSLFLTLVYSLHMLLQQLRISFDIII